MTSHPPPPLSPVLLRFSLFLMTPAFLCVRTYTMHGVNPALDDRNGQPIPCSASSLYHTLSNILARDGWWASLSATQGQTFSMGDRSGDHAVWCQKWDFMPITRAMDEQLKALLEGINALKSGQEETKNELKERMEKGQEHLRNTLEKKIDSVEEKIALKVEEKIVSSIED
ncbi:hypothetical protein TNCV_1304821 [Trichonephila clavipes]|nr:hypothetical protein TNCV_1304821 [Trichonephila clavipes]